MPQSAAAVGMRAARARGDQRPARVAPRWRLASGTSDVPERCPSPPSSGGSTTATSCTGPVRSGASTVPHRWPPLIDSNVPSSGTNLISSVSTRATSLLSGPASSMLSFSSASVSSRARSLTPRRTASGPTITTMNGGEGVSRPVSGMSCAASRSPGRRSGKPAEPPTVGWCSTRQRSRPGGATRGATMSRVGLGRRLPSGLPHPTFRR